MSYDTTGDTYVEFQRPAPLLPAETAAPTTFDNAAGDMSDALDLLQRRLDALMSRLTPIRRKPVPQAPTCGQPVPPKPFDDRSPVVSTVSSWERTIGAMADKILDIQNQLDI